MISPLESFYVITSSDSIGFFLGKINSFDKANCIGSKKTVIKAIILNFFLTYIYK